MHMTNGYPEKSIKATRKYSKAKNLILSGLTLMKRAEYWIRISALCCRSNELTAYKSALYEENLKP